jgi:TIR domain
MSVFLCYSSRNADTALHLRNSLVARDIDVWLDQINIAPGSNWQKSIETVSTQIGRFLIWTTHNNSLNPTS